MKNIFNLEIFPGHEGIYYNRDLNYILRMIKKISDELSSQKSDIDWLQGLIEFFLILNSRVYKDLLPNLVTACAKYQKIDQKIKQQIIDISIHTLSCRYHESKKVYRNRAAHGSNYLRVGIIESGNDVLPKPINYVRTQKLENMAKINDLIRMWQKDMLQVRKDLLSIIEIIIKELNSYKMVKKVILKNET